MPPNEEVCKVSSEDDLNTIVQRLSSGPTSGITADEGENTISDSQPEANNSNPQEVTNLLRS